MVTLKKISDLPLIPSVDGTEEFEVLKGGLSYRMPATEIPSITGSFTPQRFGISPDTGSVISSSLWQDMLDDIAGEGRLYIGPGTWALADPFTLSGGTDVYCAPGALFSLANLPSGSVLYTAAGSLSSAYTLSANAPMLVGAQPWAVSTIDVPQAYVVGDRRAYFGASWICMQNHTASSVSPPTIPTAAVAFNTDYLAGKWERTNVKTAASLTGIAANDRLIVQHDVRLV